MKAGSLKLAGRIISINAADQSCLIESKASSQRLRVYANDGLFKKLRRILAFAQFNGEKSKEITLLFLIQGRVLTKFTPGRKTWEDIYQATIAFLDRSPHK